MGAPRTDTERLVALETRQQVTDRQTMRLIDISEATSKALQELTAIHREGVARQEADRKTLQTHEVQIGSLWGSHRKLHKVVWTYVWVGSGVFGTLALVWKAGLLPALIGAGG